MAEELKLCQFCGNEFGRRMTAGRMEFPSVFKKRQCCSPECALGLRKRDEKARNQQQRGELLKRTFLLSTPKTCWPWLGSILDNGYGQVKDNGRGRLAHRYVYELFFGEIPEGLTLDHLCRNRVCVNPCHLEAVPIRENIMRGTGPSSENMRKTHCKRGHEFTLENTKPASGGGRCCATCFREYDARRKRFNRALKMAAQA